MLIEIVHESFCIVSIGSSGRVSGGQETLNVCGCLRWPSFYDLLSQGRGAWPPHPLDPLLIVLIRDVLEMRENQGFTWIILVLVLFGYPLPRVF